MGSPKALLRLDDQTFLTRAIGALLRGGCRLVVCVVPADDDGRTMSAEARRAGAEAVVNPDAGSEPHDSIRLGLAALPPDAEAAVVLPVDHPLVRAATVRALLAAFRARHAAIVRASTAGRPGHPTLFARRLFAELAEPDLPDGARTVVARHTAELEDVAVEDVGVHADLDTPEDLRRWREVP